MSGSEVPLKPEHKHDCFTSGKIHQPKVEKEKFANKLLVTQRLAHNVGFEGKGLSGCREDRM